MPLPIASGDPSVFLLIGGTIFLAGVVLALGVTGTVLRLGKSPEKKVLGKLLLWAMAAALVAVGLLWIAVVGLD